MKFPVIKAFSATFAYLARHGVDLAKALWLPAALAIAIQLYAMPPLFSSLASMVALGDNPDPAQAAPILGAFGKWIFILLVGSAIAYPMMAVASLRHIVRGDRLTMPFYLRFGGDELRILAAYVLLSLMIIVITIVGGLAASAIALVLALVLPNSRELANSLGEMALNIAITWFRLRLCVLYPASLATGTTGFGVAWSATKGQAWPLFFFWVLICLALAPVAIATMAPFAGDMLPLFGAIYEAGEDPAAARAAVIPILEAVSRLYSPQNPAYALFVTLLFAATVVMTAVINVAAGIAWRYLTEDDAPAQGSSQAMAA
jgi:hypothetical protein